jgi:hypothetical protein
MLHEGDTRNGGPAFSVGPLFPEIFRPLDIFQAGPAENGLKMPRIFSGSAKTVMPTRVPAFFNHG